MCKKPHNPHLIVNYKIDISVLGFFQFHGKVAHNRGFVGYLVA